MNKIKIIIISFLLFVISAFTSYMYAGTINISAPASIEVGKTVTITISGNGVSGGIKISTSNNGIISINKTSGFIDGKQGQTVSVSLKAVASGSATITVGPLSQGSVGNDDMTEYTGGNVSRVIKVTTPAPVVPPVAPPTTNNSNKTPNTTTPVKGGNTYLKSLKVDQEGLTPAFNKGIYSYSITINENVEKLGVTALAEDSTSKVSITGNTKLKNGTNTVTITVTAKNGTKKAYTILVNKTNNPELTNTFLESLIVENSKFKTDFSSEVFEYECENIAGNIDSLKLIAFAKNKNAKVEIIGNENLVVGENIITVKVTSEDGTATKEYKIKVIKDEEVVTTLAESDALENNEQTFLEKTYKFFKKHGLVLILFAMVIIEFIQILVLYFGWYKPIKKEKQKEEIVDSFNRRRKNTTELNDDNEISDENKPDEVKEYEQEERVKEDITDMIDEQDNDK